MLQLVRERSSPAGKIAGSTRLGHGRFLVHFKFLDLIEISGRAVVLLDLRIFARRDDSAREPTKPGGKANAREQKADR
jgi:hypothetical protein